MKEKNLYQLDELGNKLYTRVMQSPDDLNIMANIHLQKVGSENIVLIANYDFLEKKMIFTNKRKIKVYEHLHIPFEDCVFTYLPFEIDHIRVEVEGIFFEVAKHIFDFEKVYPDGKNNSFLCKSYFALKDLKKLKDYKNF